MIIITETYRPVPYSHHLATPLHWVSYSYISMNVMNGIHFVLTTIHEYVCCTSWFIDVELVELNSFVQLCS